MGKLIDLTGQKFGRLIVIERTLNQGIQTSWLCQCSCGQQTIVKGNNLKNGHTRSCGCLYRESRRNNRYGYKHGYSNSHTYNTWHLMLQRCNNLMHTAYKNYGGRGIRVCEAWLKFENFLQDMGERPEGMSLDRIDNDGDYCKENCRWITQGEQMRNTRRNITITIDNVTKCLKEWCEFYQLSYHKVYDRLYHGWTPEEALELITRKKK